MKFNLGLTPTQSTQGTSSILGPGIHDVKFVSATPEVIEKKDGSQSFNVLKLKFEGIAANAGKTFEHTIFEPRPGDEVRKENNFGYHNPSIVEEMNFLIGHLLAAVAPVTSKQIADKGGVEIDTWEKLTAFVVKATAKSANVETQIKLLPDKENRGRFPGFVLGISKKDELYPRTNFIGKDLTFTANELKQIEARATATPSKMPDAIGTIAQPASSVDDELELDLNLV